jgi:hypothetical protein
MVLPRPVGVLEKVPVQGVAPSLVKKPEPATATVAPTPPLLGTNTISEYTEKLTVPKSPVEPVTVIVHSPPCAPEATVNEAEREPVEVIVHVYVLGMRAEPLEVVSVADSVHGITASDGLNPDPEIVTEVPGRDAGAGTGA